MCLFILISVSLTTDLVGKCLLSFQYILTTDLLGNVSDEKIDRNGTTSLVSAVAFIGGSRSN